MFENTLLNTNKVAFVETTTKAKVAIVLAGNAEYNKLSDGSGSVYNERLPEDYSLEAAIATTMDRSSKDYRVCSVISCEPEGPEADIEVVLNASQFRQYQTEANYYYSKMRDSELVDPVFLPNPNGHLFDQMVGQVLDLELEVGDDGRPTQYQSTQLVSWLEQMKLRRCDLYVAKVRYFDYLTDKFGVVSRLFVEDRNYRVAIQPKTAQIYVICSSRRIKEFPTPEALPNPEKKKRSRGRKRRQSNSR